MDEKLIEVKEDLDKISVTVENVANSLWKGMI